MIAKDDILDAAEQLLKKGKPEFSMRELAAQAGVSFATPFNHFGSKTAVMHALSARRIEAMTKHFAAAEKPITAPARVLLAVDIAVAVMLKNPAVNRAVMAALGSPSTTPGTVHAMSANLWSTALGKGEGLTPSTLALALKTLPSHLAITFRGTLSFWTAGEYTNAHLAKHARTAAAAIMLGFVGRGEQSVLVEAFKEPEV
jgi:AcrR family transcriptional regulator